MDLLASAPSLQLPAEAERALGRWARAGHPAETCGVLLGTHAQGCTRVARAVEAKNLAPDAHARYELDPEALVAADLAARAAGLDVVGIWHAHPDASAQPSRSDQAGAWACWSYVIVPVTAAGPGVARSWRLVGDAFVEERVLR